MRAVRRRRDSAALLLAGLACAAGLRATRVTLIRHGQTEWNLLGRFQGCQDSPLTARGVEQARATRACVARLRPSAVYTSDLLRARRTAELLCPDGVPLRVDGRLRERNFGMFEGRTTAEMRELHPAEFELMRNGGRDYALPGGGESKADVLDRLVPFMHELAERHAGDDVVVVSHGATLNVLLKWALHVPIDRPCNWEQHNLGCSTLVRRGDGWKVRTICNVAHLDEAGLSDDDE
ncbi:hypothetical protein KFE25_001644 [Diacronema lutheri]|uniref:Phosphoglycerate mutase n=2 Tax=Diacronema lutheri TaxID=2081491 RepID=A0A8J5XCB3_DIALT|nr:hypothetical protein KFE25_001644 [Diacronema lutheri]